MSALGSDAGWVSALWLISMVLPFAGALAAALWPRRSDAATRGVALGALLVSAASLTVSLVLRPAKGDFEIFWHWAWLPELGLNLAFGRDGLSAMFALLVSWIAVLVVLFAWRYLPHANEHEQAQRSESSFYGLMCLFTGCMLAVVSSANTIQLYLFWEATGLASYLLIGYWNHHDEARHGATRALGVTVAGGVCLLLGLLVLGTRSGHWTFPELLHAETSQGVIFETATALVLLGALTKSAQFPFSSWLPGAMIAPTPVSAFLHSSALVAAGIYLIARFYPLLHSTWSWGVLLLVPGVVGVSYVGLLAVRQVKIKALLAYSTVSQYAFMLIGFGLATKTGVKAALYAFFVHAFIKAGLFLVAGSATYLTGKKELDQIGGMGRTHQVLAGAAFLLGLSLGGVPLLGGFYYKEELLHAALAERSWVLFGSMLLGGMLSLMYMLRFLHEMFVGPGDSGHGTPLPRTMGVPMIALAGAALLTGAFPNWMNAHIVDPAIRATLLQPQSIQVELEFGRLLVVSLATIVAGFVLWLVWKTHKTPRRWWRHIPEHFEVGAGLFAAGYRRLAGHMLRLHSGRLSFYLRWVLSIFLLGSAALFYIARFPDGLQTERPVAAEMVVLLASVMLVSISSLFLSHHLALGMLLTVLGFSLAGVFVLMKAPNVALAQVLVETLASLSVVLALYLSGRVKPKTSRTPGHTLSGVDRWGISLGSGVLLATGTYLAAQAYPVDALGTQLSAQSEQLGKQDFVAAILTEFRALDTLIEITVFATAVVACAGLYWKHRENGEEGQAHDQ